jgi:diamine N-acetyltransferase
MPASNPAAPTRGSVVTLRPIDPATVRAVCRLAVTEQQNQFVAPNAISLAEAYVTPEAWPRAIYADDTPVGFAMLEVKPDVASYYLWRFMIDARYQAFGFGRRALELIIEHVKAQPNATHLTLSIVQAPGGPQRFYEGLGFRLTGEYEEGEAIMRLDFARDGGG